MNIAIAQSGGPTSAINASLAGILEECEKTDKIGKVYGSLYGIEGLIEGDLVDMSDHIDIRKDLDLLIRTPAAVLGSCRKKLPDFEEDDSVYKIIAENLKKNGIEAFFYIGGNDSMDTVDKLSGYFREKSTDICVIGIPKTIDNDLLGTDHCPGYGSAAKYIVSTVQEIIRDSNAYNTPSVTVIETMGRHAGWLTASAACVKRNEEHSPQLIYLPEVVFSDDKFIGDVRERLSSDKTVVAVVSEGVKTSSGKFAAENYQSAKKDAFGHSYLSGIGKYLEDLVTTRIGCKVRSIELNVMQRCSSHIASLTDINEAREVGKKAVTAALSGMTGIMISLERVSSDPYQCNISYVPAGGVANKEKCFPAEWIDPSGNSITEEGVDYIFPLIYGELPPIIENGLIKHFKII